DYLNGPWVNNMVMGINVGPMLLAIENARSHQIWDLMARNAEITAGLDTIFGIGSPETETITNQNGNQNTITLRWKPQPGASKYLIFASSFTTASKARIGPMISPVPSRTKTISSKQYGNDLAAAIGSSPAGMNQ